MTTTTTQIPVRVRPTVGHTVLMGIVAGFAFFFFVLALTFGLRMAGYQGASARRNAAIIESHVFMRADLDTIKSELRRHRAAGDTSRTP